MNKISTITLLLSFAALSLLASAAWASSSAPLQKKDKTANFVSKTKKSPKDNADMIFIPAGEFVMGSTEYKPETPVHKVILDGYYIYRIPVTVAQYLKFCEETGYQTPAAPAFNPNWSKQDHPIVNVSYEDALEYCKWASGDKRGSVRLPTEAQWEKAASWDDVKKQKRRFPWGDEFDITKVRGSGEKVGDTTGTKPVGTFPSSASPYGVLDMIGNVWQWCSDWFDWDFYSNRLAVKRNPENQSIGEKKERVVRGGSFLDSETDEFLDGFRCAYRNHNLTGKWTIYGFRCVYVLIK